MAEIVNLRRARKSKAKESQARTADANRIEFGRTKAERKVSKATHESERKKLDGSKIDLPPNGQGKKS